jgi:hypothetical protein
VKCSKKHSPKIRGDVDKMEEQPCEIGEFRTELQSVSSTRASKAPLTNVGGKSEVIKTRRSSTISARDMAMTMSPGWALSRCTSPNLRSVKLARR